VARKGGYNGLLRRNFVIDREASDEFHNALIGSASMGAAALILYALEKIREEGVDLLVT